MCRSVMLLDLKGREARTEISSVKICGEESA